MQELERVPKSRDYCGFAYLGRGHGSIDKTERDKRNLLQKYEERITRIHTDLLDHLDDTFGLQLEHLSGMECKQNNESFSIAALTFPATLNGFSNSWTVS